MRPLKNVKRRGRTTPLAEPSRQAHPVPDPDLPNVEEAILEATEQGALCEGSPEKDGRDICEHVAGLLVDALVKDLAACKIRLLSDTLSAFMKNDAHNGSQNETLKGVRRSDGERDKLAEKCRKEPHSNTSTVSDYVLEQARMTAKGTQNDDALAALKRTSPYSTSKPEELTSPQKRARTSMPAAKPKHQAFGKEASGSDLNVHPGKVTSADNNFRMAGGGVGNENPTGNASKQNNESAEVEQKVLCADGVQSTKCSKADMEMDDCQKRRLSPNLPWWRSVESRMSLPMRHVKDENVLRGYIMTLIRSCVCESWKAEKLRESYARDPASNKGRAFLAVSSSLLMMERARHVGQCRMNWSTELLRELLQRRDIEWSPIEHDPTFPQFVGCEVCLAHRPATKLLKLKGAKYDSRDFWPTSSVVDVLSTSEEKGVLSLAVELAPGCRPGQCANIDDDDEIEFWVDEQCLRKCLVFHELVHSTSILTEDIMYMVEDELRDGIVEIPKSSDLCETGTSVVELLEAHLVDVLSRNEDFMKRRIAHFIDIIRLGDMYFSPGHGEVKTGGLTISSKLYDAPTELNDEAYGDRVRKLESLTENKISRDPFPTFC